MKDFTKFYFIGIFFFIISAIIFSLINYTDIFLKTQVERVVFENSYQYKQGQKERIATLEAEIDEIENRLTNPNLDATIKKNLENQLSRLKIELIYLKKLEK